MTARVFRRVLAMDRAEVQFRTASAARRLVQRTTALTAPPRWRREDLYSRLARAGRSTLLSEAGKALRRRDWFGAHELLGQHYTTRASLFPPGPDTLDRVAQTILQRHPDARADAQERGAKIVRGCYDLLGHANVPYGTDPDWHFDAVSGRRAPTDFWADVPYLDPGLGDHKVIWELNRHQHWLQLGRASKLTGEHAFYDRFLTELQSWMRANPPLAGINWASMLELAFRSLSWLWAIAFFSPLASTRDRFPWLVDLLLGLDRQLDHVSRNLSRYFSPNTHLTGEALALYVSGRSLPELRRSGGWMNLGRSVLLEEATNQVASDGGHVELSAHYHRYSTDFYLLAALVAKRSGDPAAPALERAARRQALYLRTICNDRGYRPFTGDDDGGQLFPICGRPSDDCRDTLSTASILLGQPDLAVGGTTEETYWQGGGAPEVASRVGAPWRSAVLDGTGYCVSRTPGSDHLVFDAGPHGFKNGGHAHADALSVILTVAGQPLLIDPGTATYTMDPAVRDRFRSTAMHNTVVVGGRSQSEPAGAFHWASQAASRLKLGIAGEGCDYFEAAHDGYAPVWHARAVLAVHGIGWVFVDFTIAERPVAADAHWHLHPMWRPEPLSECAVQCEHGKTRVQILSSRPLRIIGPDDESGLSEVSPAYGRVRSSHTLRASIEPREGASLLTFVDPAARDRAGRIESLPLTRIPATGWLGSAYRITTACASMLLLACTERDGPLAPARKPAAAWGVDGFQTDGRLACLITHKTGALEAVVVQGGRIERSNAPSILVPPDGRLSRLAAAQLA